MDELAPGQKPKFATDPAPDEDYPGYVETPIFDSELEALDVAPPVSVDLGTTAQPDVHHGSESKRQIIAKLHACGVPNKLIAEYLCYSPGGLSNALKHPRTQALIAEERKKLDMTEAIDIIRDTARAAAVSLQRIALDPSHKFNYAALESTLDRAIGKPGAHISVSKSNTIINITQMIKESMATGQPIEVRELRPEAQLPAADTGRWDNIIDALQENSTLPTP